jgi:2-keto-4-pentenoate hydratase/2-oxohepta-3-ene-1,7-dioic acid hydratase in catechol pathway
MKQNRRDFLKTAGAATALIGSAAVLAGPAAAQPRRITVVGPTAMPKGLTFATLRKGSALTLGVKTGEGVLDIAAAERDLKEGAPVTIEEVIHQKKPNSALVQLVEKVRGNPRYTIPVARAQFGPVVTNPEKIICVGLNYRSHVAEANQALPTTPILFNKFSSALNHHGGTIVVSEENATQFDYEGELVIVIGRQARNVIEADALSYAFGYCTGHDFSARDLQMRTSQWMLGKAGDGWGPVGPWLVSADQVDPDNLDIKTLVNGEVRQFSNTKNMIFNCAQIISYASKYMTLKPGDIIFTGTPEGVIAGYPKEKQVWLKKGDTILTSIEKLGDQVIKLT